MTTWLSLFNLLVLVLTAFVCLGQTLWRRGLRQVALFAYGTLAAAVAAAQLLLLQGVSAQVRVSVIAVAAFVQLLYVAVLVTRRFDDEPEARDWADLEPATRNLIRRHPDLLIAFERWRRTHDTPEER